MTRRRAIPLAGLLPWLAGCKPSPETEIRAIIGAVLLDGAGGPPLADSVVLTAGSRIRAAGSRPSIPIPAGSEKVNGAGKFLLPGFIELDAKLDSGDPLAQLSRYSSQGVTSLRGQADGLSLFHADDLPARWLGPEPEMPAISTLEEVQRLVDSGTNAFLGMITDTEEIAPDFLRHLHHLRVVFAPRLTGYEDPALLSLAQRNTRRLAAAGVSIAVASAPEPGLGTHRELELLSAAGLSPLEVLAAASLHGARAAGQEDELGTITPEKKADLLLVGANPLEDIRNLRKIERVMVDGRWRV